MGGFCVTRPVDCCNVGAAVGSEPDVRWSECCAMESPLSEDKGPKKIVTELSLPSRIANTTPDPKPSLTPNPSLTLAARLKPFPAKNLSTNH